MLAANRYEEIMKLLNKDRFVKVSQLSKLFNVSEETVRRDLDKLEKDGLLKKLHGGAVPVNITSVNNIKPIKERIEENISEKSVIAKLAYDLIEDGDTLILDTGSSILHLARILDEKNVTVITNDVSIAYELSQKENVNLIITGGNLKPNSYTIIGPECEKAIASFNVNKLFLSTSGIKLQQGLTTSNKTDAHIKQRMIASADKTICLADHSKFGKVALVTFADISDLDMIVTDCKPDNSYLEALSNMKVQLVTP